MKSLTPSKSTDFKDVRGNIDIKDFYKSQIHVDRLESHPGERGQKEVVKNSGHGNTEPVVVKRSKPGINQEQHVKTQQGP